MKIVLNKKEIESLGRLKTSMQGSLDLIADAMDESDDKADIASLTKIATTCKFANINIGFHGVTININPEFVQEFLVVYGQMISHTTDIVVATIKACNAMDKLVEDRLDKWF